MEKSRSVKKRAKFERNKSPLSRPALMTLLGAVVAIFGVFIALAAAGPSKSAAAATNPAPQAPQKRYKATHPIIVDRQTGQLRMPTRQEIDELVGNLATLANRPTEGLQQTSVANGGVAIDVGGGYGGVMLARPNDDGTWETKCVFTFEEGAEFLGITEDNSPQ
jgi:hypothetical protein